MTKSSKYNLAPNYTISFKGYFQRDFINIQRMIYSKSPQRMHLFDLILLFLDINVSYHWQTLFNRFSQDLLI